MKIYIATCAIGSFAFGENKELVAYKLFPHDTKAVAEKLVSNEIVEEEKQIIEKLKQKGFDKFFIRQQKFFNLPSDEKNNFFADEKDFGEEILREKFRELGLKFLKSQEELNKFLSEINLEITKSKLRKTERDRIAIQIIGMADDLDKILNTLVERLREWYGLYFPEINDLVKNHENFVEFVANKTRRENFERNGKKLEFESAGMSFDENDLNEVREVSKYVLGLFATRKNLEIYLKRIMDGIAPNTTALCGPELAARLVAKAGGLEKLAKLPSSTIQLLGSEKALFRFLKGHGKSPKHGIIFFHPHIIQSPIPIRGKIAKLLASKIAIAARIDCYSKEDRSGKLKEDLESSVKKINEDFRKQESK